MAGSFKKASAFFRKGNYAEVTRILEPQIFRFRDSGEFYYLLGMSCLFNGDIGGAFTYLQRAVDLDKKDISPLLALAMTHMHRQENSEALRCWLRVLELEPKNKKAQKGLNFLKSPPRQEQINDLLEEGKLDRLLPEKKRAAGKPKKLAIILAACVVLGIAVPVVLGSLGAFPFPRERREDYTNLNLRDFDSLFESAGNFEIILTQGEIRKAVDSMNRYFLNYQDNLAMREINRILLSNAHREIKEQVSLLENNIARPTFANFKDNFTYQEVKAQPLLYRRCCVSWKGRAVNVHVGSQEISFDFLVDYQDQRTLSGTVPVVLDFAAEVTPDFPMELLAEVVPSGSGNFHLKGISFHRIWD